MTQVVADMSMSLDGFIAGTGAWNSPMGGQRLHEWLFDGEVPSRHGRSFKLSESSRDVFDEMLDVVGATVAGRRWFDVAVGWNGEPPFIGPVFVVTHAPPAQSDETGRFTFVTDGVEQAVEMAKAVAEGKAVRVGGASIIQQCLRAHLLDELHIHLVPVLLGAGVRLFDDMGPERIELECTRVVASPTVTHLRYRVPR